MSALRIDRNNLRINSSPIIICSNNIKAYSIADRAIVSSLARIYLDRVIKMILQWNIGEVTITRILEIELKVAYYTKYPFMREAHPEALAEIPWLSPNFVTDDGELIISIHALLVQTPKLNLLVDTCVGNDKARAITGNEALHTEFLKDLEAAGCSREKIDAVVCTHLHVDHVGWNTMKVGDNWTPTFPNARYLIGRIEYDYWSQSDADDQIPVMLDSVTPIFEAGLADLVDFNHVISPEIRLIPTTGHTPGHVSVVIESRGEKALITGDSMHHPCQIARPHWTVSFDEDGDAAQQCRNTLLADIADTGTLVIGTHFASPTAGKVISDGEAYKLIF
jgi:glyoxylase-like metal-dependent hydrolase (beta-lactamase superfamily II)